MESHLLGSKDAFRQWLIESLSAGPASADKIRQGGQGHVLGPVDYRGKPTALKIIDYTGKPNTRKIIQDFEREYKNLEALSHPSIVQFIEFRHELDQNRAYIYMQWASTELKESQFGGALNLEDVICHRDGKHSGQPKSLLPEAFIWHVLFHLSAALSLCHHGISLKSKKFTEELDTRTVLNRLTNRPSSDLRELSDSHPIISLDVERITFSLQEKHPVIIHRDIKPANILLSDPIHNDTDFNWKSIVSLGEGDLFCVFPVTLLCDFGLSVDLTEAKTYNIGSFGFQAPEIPFTPHRPNSVSAVWKESCDIFSLGATLWNLMTLEELPSSLVDSAQVQKIPETYSAELRDLLSQCYTTDVSLRPSAIELLDACIRRGTWRDSCVSPYGHLTASDFDSTLKDSWRDCLDKLGSPIKSIAITTSATGLLDDSFKIVQLAQQERYGKLAVFIAGAYFTKNQDESLAIAAEDLQDQLSLAMVESAFDAKTFLPRESLSNILTRPVMKKCLLNAPPELIEFSWSQARTIFAIAISIGHLGHELQSTMEQFKYHELTDFDLPLSMSASARGVFRGWRRFDVRQFVEAQWKFLAPVFEKDIFRYVLKPQEILPFREVEQGRSGHFSQVTQVVLQRGHQRDLFPDTTETPHIAVKEFKGSDRASNVKELWESEVDVLYKLGKLRHTRHLIRGIAAISRNDRYYILFDWADGGDLRDFWQSHPNPAENPKQILAFVDQMSGLCSGLARLHGYYHTDHLSLSNLSLNADTNAEYHEELEENSLRYRHGDIKPEKILLFLDHSSWLGTMKIADFGTAKFHRVDTFKRQETFEMYGTVQYEAPETVTRAREPKSRLFDVWSMGCVFLECVIWLLYGSRGLQAFHDHDDSHGRLSNFYIFTSSDTAEVHPRVSAWIESILEHDPECNRSTGSALRDLLKLIRDKLLVVELPDRLTVKPQTRINAGQLSQELSSIHEKASGQSGYIFAGRERRGEAGAILQDKILPRVSSKLDDTGLLRPIAYLDKAHADYQLKLSP